MTKGELKQTCSFSFFFSFHGWIGRAICSRTSWIVGAMALLQQPFVFLKGAFPCACPEAHPAPEVVHYPNVEIAVNSFRHTSKYTHVYTSKWARWFRHLVSYINRMWVFWVLCSLILWYMIYTDILYHNYNSTHGFGKKWGGALRQTDRCHIATYIHLLRIEAISYTMPK